MKTVNLKYVSLLLLGCGLLMACVSPSLRITHAPTDPSQIPGSDTVATTVTPIRNSSPATISSTQILLPVQTITPSDENKSTPRPFISPPPTLALEFQKEFFDLLKTNGGCELPCFLGVIPGKSSWSQASERLKKFTHQNSFLPNWYFYPDGTAAPRSPEEFYAEISTTKDVSLNVHIIFAVESDHVKKITFDTITLFDRNGAHFSRYSLFDVFCKIKTDHLG